MNVVRFRLCFFLGFSSSDSLPSLSGESGHTEASPVLLAQHTPANKHGEREKKKKKFRISKLRESLNMLLKIKCNCFQVCELYFSLIANLMKDKIHCKENDTSQEN